MFIDARTGSTVSAKHSASAAVMDVYIAIVLKAVKYFRVKTLLRKILVLVVDRSLSLKLLLPIWTEEAKEAPATSAATTMKVFILLLTSFFLTDL